MQMESDQRTLASERQSMTTSSAARPRGLDRLIEYRRLLDQPFRRFSLVGDTPFFDPVRFPWVYTLEENWRVIRTELDAVLERRAAIPSFQAVSSRQERLTQDDRWKVFFLFAYGHKAEKNCRQCPHTTALLEQVPGMKTAMFSILAPTKHLPAHQGLYAGVLRYHLGLKVPAQAERCRIRVADHEAHWQEGKSLVFDDTYDHEVWNDTDEERVVLFLDVLRPLPFPIDQLNRGILWLAKWMPAVQQVRRNQDVTF